MIKTISIKLLYSGMIDYWSGNSDRWDDNKGCLFAHYDSNTTVRDIIDEFYYDFITGGDLDNVDITEEELRNALYDNFLSEEGRKDYDNNKLSDYAKGFREDRPDYDPESDEELPVVIILVEVDSNNES